MTFINKSVNYSTTILLKQQLKNVLKSYSDYITNVADDFVGNNTYYVPNNDNKYYMFVVPKHKIEPCREKYFICYFFNNSCEKFDDFYMEVDDVFDNINTNLFEGYLYKSNDKQSFLLTDVLVYNNNNVKLDFLSKRALIESVATAKLKNLQNSLDVGIHPYFDQDNRALIDLLTSNFIFRDQIKSIETISNVQKTQQVSLVNNKKSKDMKRIKKTKYSDVYEVFDTESNEQEGILYVRGLVESKYLRENVKEDGLLVECIFNEKFCKWQPSLKM